MARYSLIQIGSHYLTSDGTASGDRCRTSVAGLGSLSLDHTGSVVTALDGTPYVQTTANRRRGLPLSVTVEQMSKTLFESLVGTVQTAISTSATVDVRISGDTGVFSFSCVPGFPNPVELPGSFIEGRIQSVTFNFIVKDSKLAAEAGSFLLTGASATLTKST